MPVLHHNLIILALLAFQVALAGFILKRKTWPKWWRLLLVALIAALNAALFIIMPVKDGRLYGTPASEFFDPPEVKAQRQYASQAWAYFHERCQSESGRIVHTPVREPQRSIYILNPHPQASGEQLRDQHWMGDPYTLNISDPQGAGLYSRLLDNDRDWNTIGVLEFVEAPAPKGHNPPYWRYTSVPKARQYATTESFRVKIWEAPPGIEHIKTAASQIQSRYGLIRKDISTEEDRRWWVARSLLQVVELQTGQVIAERTGFVIEEGFGDTAAGPHHQWPWLATGAGNRRNTNYCPIDPAVNDNLWVIALMLNKPFEQVQQDYEPVRQPLAKKQERIQRPAAGTTQKHYYD